MMIKYMLFIQVICTFKIKPATVQQLLFKSRNTHVYILWHFNFVT